MKKVTDFFFCSTIFLEIIHVSAKNVYALFNSYATCTTSALAPSYSPAHDENWPQTLAPEDHDEINCSLLNAEDSNLTTFR